jgi:threonine synthase
MPGIWKYKELLPVDERTHIISLGEGGTFLQKCERLAKAIGINELYIKNETTNPTGSFIDRGVSVVITKIKEFNFKSVCCASPGNLGASLAAYSAKAGLKCIVYIPSRIDIGKLYQMIAYRAEIKLVKNFENFYEIDKKTHEGYPLTPIDPCFLEGEKTIGFEICEQLGWHSPDKIIVPMGTGGHIFSIWKAIKELKKIDFIKHNPELIGVQSKSCAPIVEAFKNKRVKIKSISEKNSLAVDISIKHPPYKEYALKAIKESNGDALAVSDHEMIDASKTLAEKEGIFAEPAAASTLAALKELKDYGKIDKNERIICIITGAGLKDPITLKRFTERERRVSKLIGSLEGSRITTKLGKTKISILEILSRGACYGYGIWKALKNYNLEIKIPSVYQHLNELIILGLIEESKLETTERGRERLYYSLTEKGKNVLNSLKLSKL